MKQRVDYRREGNEATEANENVLFDEAIERALSPNWQDDYEDDAKASGTSLEIGSDAYRAMVMDAHDVEPEDQKAVERGVESWEETVVAHDKATPDEQEREYRQDIAADREAVSAPVEVDDTYVEDERTRLQANHLARHAQAMALADALADAASETASVADDEIAQDAIDQIESGTHTMSAAEMKQFAADTRERMETAADDDEMAKEQRDEPELSF